MHIAFLTPEYPSSRTGRFGGIGTSIFNLASSLVTLGHTVSVFVYGQSIDDQFLETGVNIYRIKNVKLKGLSWLLTKIKVSNKINSIVKNEAIDILETIDWTGFSAWLSINCPVVMRLHGSDTYFCHLDKRRVRLWNKLQERSAFLQADKVIGVSDYVGLITNKIFGSSRLYTVIPNSIHVGDFKHENCEYEQSNVILNFGTLIRKKGALEIPLIFNKVYELNPLAKLLLVGSDSPDIQTGCESTWKLMEPLFTSEALKNVNYLGKKPYNEISEYIKKADICLFPSFAEALPVSWLEAMAMGKAIVASNIGWAPEMISDGVHGYLIHPTNHEEYAKTIQNLLKNPCLRKELGVSARGRVESQFCSSIVAKKNIEFYNSFFNK